MAKKKYTKHGSYGYKPTKGSKSILNFIFEMIFGLIGGIFKLIWWLITLPFQKKEEVKNEPTKVIPIPTATKKTTEKPPVNNTDAGNVAHNSRRPI